MLVRIDTGQDTNPGSRQAGTTTGHGVEGCRGRMPAVGFLASRRWRLFLIAWLVYSVHFATNVVREHYPAFSLAEHGTFRVDEYQGFHADIFVHRDGHSYVGNNVIVSVLAAVPLFVFDPVLDLLERHSQRQLKESAAPPAADYRTPKPKRRAFFKLVKERGLELRFGAATVVTSAFFMAPITALFVVLVFEVLRRRGVATEKATWMSFLFAFGTPVFFRQAHLNHNMFFMFAMFIAFLLLWAPGREHPLAPARRLAAGFFAGFCLATDYIGVIVLPLLYLYLLLSRTSTARWLVSFKESLAFVAGSVPPVLFLLYSQWAMYGDPFLPGQAWMPQQNIYTEVGMRGFDWPSPDLFFLNLFSPSYGLYVYGPLLLLGLWPAVWSGRAELILPRRERRFVAACFVVFLIFCAANQYSRLQFNSGVRYLVPLIPFLFLAACDQLSRLSRRWLLVVSTVAVLHSWVTTVFREPIPQAWSLFAENGIQLPWLMVLRMTSPPGDSLLWHPLLPTAILAGTLLLAWAIWAYGAASEAAPRRPAAVGTSS